MLLIFSAILNIYNAYPAFYCVNVGKCVVNYLVGDDCPDFIFVETSIMLEVYSD